MSIGARIATWWPCSLSLSLFGFGHGFDRYGPRTISSTTRSLPSRIDLGTANKEWEDSLGRRHEFGTTNGHSVLWCFGRGETLGDLGSLGVMEVFENGHLGRELSCRVT